MLMPLKAGMCPVERQAKKAYHTRNTLERLNDEAYRSHVLVQIHEMHRSALLLCTACSFVATRPQLRMQAQTGCRLAACGVLEPSSLGRGDKAKRQPPKDRSGITPLPKQRSAAKPARQQQPAEPQPEPAAAEPGERQI